MSSKRIQVWGATALVTLTGIILAAVLVSAQAPTPAPSKTLTAAKAPVAAKPPAAEQASANDAGMRFTGTTDNVVGAHDSIRIDLMHWSNDADRTRTMTAWTQAQARAAAVAASGRGAAGGADEGGDKIKVITPGDAKRSPLILKISDQTGKQMPPQGPLSDADIAVVFGWVERGAKPEDFAKDVQPIFTKNCVSCHSGASPKAGLHLDTLEGVLKGGDDLEAAASARLAAAAAGEEGGGAAPASPLTPEGSLVAALEKSPVLGYVWSSSEISGYAVHYAVRLPQPNGGERVILITDRRLGDENDFWQPAGPAAAKKEAAAANYGFSVIELHFDSKGQGEGKISLSNKIGVDNNAKAITLANYSEMPVVLKNVARKGVEKP